MKLKIIVLFTILNLSYGQVKYQKGIYLTYDEVIANKPSANYNVELEKRTENEIKMNGGNDYQLNALDGTTNRSNLKKLVIAYSDGENLYLNCTKLEISKWYAKVISNKKYFVFSGAFPNKYKDYGLELDKLPFMFGGLGGGLSAMKLALLRFPYIMEKSTKKITLVSEKNIAEILANDEELMKEYNKDLEKNKIQTILKYLTKWNERQ
jgi:methyltransferase-like protein